MNLPIRRHWRTMFVTSLFAIALPGAFALALAATPSDTLCYRGCPTGAPADNTVVERQIYVLSNNPHTKFADWVAYRITMASFGPTRARNWKADPDLDPNDTLERADYATSFDRIGVDHGHQAPLASVAGSSHWPEANYLSNITPQQADLNEGAWERLEQAERDIVADGLASVIYAFTGPLYERSMPPLPKANEPHRVPSGYWKIIAVPKAGGFDVMGFILDQDTARGEDFCEHEATPGSIETRAHLTFFQGAAASTRQSIRSGQAIGQVPSLLGCE
jgi:endonuclease G